MANIEKIAYWGQTPIRKKTKSGPRKEPLSLTERGLTPIRHYPPKLSYMIDAGSTPRLSSIPVTAFDMGPGPHM